MSKKLTDLKKPIAKSLLELSTVVVPAVGPIASIVLDKLWHSPFEERLINWITIVEKYITKSDDIDWKLIIESNEFQTLFINSTLAAIKTHKKEKIRILGISLLKLHKENIEFDFKQYLHEQIQGLTVLHLSVLFFLFKNKNQIQHDEYIQNHFNAYIEMNECDITNDQYYFICKDLEERNLIKLGEIKYNSADYVRVSPAWSSAPDNSLPFISITKLGNDILKYTIESNV